MGAGTAIDHNIIFFDGICNLCNSSVNFIITRDREARFKFAPLQSEIAKNYLDQTEEFESIVLLTNGGVYKKSTAALKIARELKGGWKLLYIFIILPKFLRDFFYDIIAKNRYKWFGKKDACMVPTPELKSRFLDSN